jgi:iron complex outermembrane receptor protein
LALRTPFALIVLFISSIVLAQDAAPKDAGKSSSSQKPPQVKEELVVTGTYAPVPMEEADRDVTSIDVDALPHLLRTWGSALQSDPALDLRQRAPGIQGDLSMRGSSFGQTLVLVNGLRLNDAQSAHHNLDLPFPFESIGRVEVLHGSGSTLYGSDALGGAVNFITAPPVANELRFGTAFGNFGTNQQNGSAAFVAKKWSEQLTFTRELSTGFMPDRDYRNLSFASESDYKSHLGRTAVMLGYSDRPFGANQFYGNYNSWERTKGWFASMSQELGANTEADFGYRRHTDIFVLLRDKPAVYKNDHETDSWQAALRRHNDVAKNTRVYYGAEGYRDSIDSTNLGLHGRNRGALYGSLDVRALHRFSFNVGAREEFYKGGNEFSPSVSGGYWVSSHVKLRASASHAFRLPTYTDLYYHDPANIGDPNLKPESAWSYEGGAEFNFGQHVASLTVFHRRDHNVIDYVRDSTSSPWQATNIQNLQFTGVEAAVQFRLGNAQRIDVAYSGITGAQQSLGALQSKYVFNYPTNSGSIAWVGKIPGQVTTRLRTGVVQRYKHDPYPLVELSASREFRYVRPFVQLTNAANIGYEEIAGVRMPGRQVMAGMEFRWGTKQ